MVDDQSMLLLIYCLLSLLFCIAYLHADENPNPIITATPSIYISFPLSLIPMNMFEYFSLPPLFLLRKERIS